LPNGVVAINVGRTTDDRRLVDALTRTLLEVFPDVYAMDVPRSFNTILVATVQPTSAANLAANTQLIPAAAPALLRETLVMGAESLVPTNLSTTVFTDDRAPLETMVDALTLNFLLNGNVDEIR